MKLVIKLLFLSISSIILCLLIAFFADRGFTIEQKFNTNQSSDHAYNYLKFGENLMEANRSLNNQKNTKIWHTGEDGKKGAKFYWSNRDSEIGNGYCEIIDLSYSKQITLLSKTNKPKKLRYHTDITFSDSDEGCEITFKITSQKNWPFNLFYLFNNPKEKLEIELKETINNLKSELKKDE